MSYDVYLTETFQNHLKSLKKKYRSIKDDIIDIIRQSEDDPTIGDQIPGWNKEIWKIRVAKPAPMLFNVSFFILYYKRG